MHAIHRRLVRRLELKEGEYDIRKTVEHLVKFARQYCNNLAKLFTSSQYQWVNLDLFYPIILDRNSRFVLEDPLNALYINFLQPNILPLLKILTS